jgi:predicted MFS family arabinose efflux permease
VFLYGPLHLKPVVVGAILTVAGFAAIAGALSSGPVARLLGTGRTLGITAIVSGGTLALMPLAQILPAVPTLMVILVFSYYQNPINNVTQVSLRQRLTPPRLHGRMNAIFRLVYWTAWPLGNLTGGALGAQIGLRSTFYIGGGLAMAGGVVMLLTRIGRYRD